MRPTLAAMLLILSVAGTAHAHPAAYPGCEPAARRAPPGDTAGDPRLAQVQMRAAILQADLGSARKARALSQRDADALWRRVDRVTRDAGRLTKRQGFLSAAERASYDRELDRVAPRLCRR